MKKWISVFLCIVMLLGLFGCGKAPAVEQPVETVAPTTVATTIPEETTLAPETTEATEPVETTVPVVTEPPNIPEIYPDVVGIYIPADDGTKTRVQISEFTSVRKAKKDIDCFEIFASTVESVTGKSFRAMWNAVWESHENRDNAKIGFEIEFTCGDNLVKKTLLKPSDAEEFFDYLEIYMYDDIHQTPGQWYTHLDDDDMKEETIISSIKLTSGSKIAEVGDIILTAFIYNGEDCFNASGAYIGTVISSVTIKEEQ